MEVLPTALSAPPNEPGGGLPFNLKVASKVGRKLVLAQVPDEVLSKLEVVPVRTIQEALSRVLDEPGASPA